MGMIVIAAFAADAEILTAGRGYRGEPPANEFGRHFAPAIRLIFGPTDFDRRVVCTESLIRID